MKTLIESFQYPRKGPGMMWEAAARKIKKRGGKVLNGPRAAAACPMTRRQASGTSTSRRNDGGRETYTAHHVICSAPVRELMEKISPRADLAPACARTALSRLSYRRADGARSPTLFPDNWIYIHDPSVKVGRVQNFRSWSPRDGAGRA